MKKKGVSAIASLFAIVSVIFLIMFAITLFTSEYRMKWDLSDLEIVRQNVKSAKPDEIDPDLEGKLIHLYGKVETDAILKDPVFGIKNKGFRLVRNVFMYQWKEEIRRDGATHNKKDVPHYSKTWCESVIDSAKFMKPEYKNPSSFPINKKIFVAEKSNIGVRHILKVFTRKIPYTFRPVKSEEYMRLSEKMRSHLKLINGKLYSCANHEKPEIGDIRVEFEGSFPGYVSIIASQYKNGFKPWKGGSRPIMMMKAGELSIDEMIGDDQESIADFKNLFRLITLIVFWISLFVVRTVYFSEESKIRFTEIFLSGIYSVILTGLIIGINIFI